MLRRGRDATPGSSAWAARYANEHRPWELYQPVFYDVLEHYQREAAGHKRKFRFKHDLLSIDSIKIALSLSMFDRAQYKRSKGAVKLHLVLDHDGYLPHYAVISDGKEATSARPSRCRLRRELPNPAYTPDLPVDSGWQRNPARCVEVRVANGWNEHGCEQNRPHSRPALSP